MPDRSPFNTERIEDELAPALLAVVRQTYVDLHRRPDCGIPLRLDSSLDRDLGFDSLARVELLLRVERALDVTLPGNTLQLTETPRDILRALRAAGTGRGGVPAVVPGAAGQFGGGAADAPAEGTTLLEVLAWHVREHGDRTQVIHLTDTGEERITYGGLYREAAAVAAGLQRGGLEPRQTVAIMLPTSPEYFYVYLGILLAGGIPVPIYPPVRLSQIEEHVRRHAGILASAQAAVLVTVREAMAVARLLEAAVPDLRRVVTTSDLSKERGEAQGVRVT
ncbi:MAG TPA: AMP-binding protein, partial [Burkholderiales bacterium]